MVRHLPPTVKQLLALRNPNPLSSPSLARLKGLLTTSLTDARQRKAETGWLVLMTCTLLTTNRPSALGHLYRFVTRSEPSSDESRDDRIKASIKAALIRESALKSTIFVGVPRVLNSLAALSEALEDDVKRSMRTESLRIATPENVVPTIARGRALWDSIYQPHADKLHDKLASYHPDFIPFIIQCYGSVLAPLTDVDEQGNLSRTLSSVVGVACLRAEGGVGPQLTSHVFGLLKARYEENLNEEDAWLSSDEGAEWVLRTVDKILDDVTSDGELRGKL